MLKRYGSHILFSFGLLIIFQLYIYTTYPAFKNDDSPETTTSVYTLGIGHPPSYPLFTMAGKVFSLLPLGSPAFRINLFSIFLALCVLIVTYIVIRKNLLFLYSYENKYLNFISMFILAFSYIFWNQAIEAKGGIYILNLLFLVIILYCSLIIFTKFTLKYFYLLTYIYGLSLSNHWPSMIILLPLFGFLLYKYISIFNSKKIMIMLIFIVLGLSSYLYLPIRAGIQNVFIFMQKPDTWKSFFWTIFRSVYSNSEIPIADVYKNQAMEYFNLFIKDFSFLWVTIFFGMFSLWKAKKGLMIYFLFVYLITLFAIIRFNNTPQEILWVVDNFSIPAQYVAFIFLVNGCYFLIKSFRGFHNRIYNNILIVVVVGITLYSGYIHFKKNNNRNNYISYDFVNNIVQTLEPDSFFLVEGDNVMRLNYVQWIQHRAQTIKPINMISLESWGIADFQKKYGNMDLKPGVWTDNAVKIINNLANKYPIFMENYGKPLDYNMDSLVEKPRGILYKISNSKENISSTIFDTYSYRGIYNTSTSFDAGILYLYGGMMAIKGIELFKENKVNEAITLLETATLFPAENDIKGNIYFNLAHAYKITSDHSKERECLLKTIELRPDFWQAYSAAGMSYYQDKLYPLAKDMFEKAIRCGSPNSQMLEQYITAINQMQENSR
jgi:hypothetical protein